MGSALSNGTWVIRLQKQRLFEVKAGLEFWLGHLFWPFYLKLTLPIHKNADLALTNVAQLVGYHLAKQKSHWFNSQPGHMPGLFIWSPDFIFLSLSSSLPLSLRINKILFKCIFIPP